MFSTRATLFGIGQKLDFAIFSILHLDMHYMLIRLHGHDFLACCL